MYLYTYIFFIGVSGDEFFVPLSFRNSISYPSVLEILVVALIFLKFYFMPSTS